MMSSSATSVSSAPCPECSAGVDLDAGVLQHEIVQCGECGAELEVTGIEPVALALAPEVEEDWGE